MASNGVWVVDAGHMRELRFMHTGVGAHGLYPSRDSTRLFVSNRGEGTISVVSFRTRRIVDTWRIPGGGSPDMGGLSADGRIPWLSGRSPAATRSAHRHPALSRLRSPPGEQNSLREQPRLGGESMDLGRLLLRGAVGALFVGHGTQKLFGWFGGHGLDGTGGFFENLGLRPGRRHATAAGIAEAGGGALLALGAATPVAATAISAIMLTAIRKVHLPKGPWVTEGGYEYNLALVALMTALVETGPGRASVDAALFPRWKGTGWALASLAAAGVGTYLATGPLNEPEPAPQPEAMTDEERATQPRFQREPSGVPADQTA